MAALLTGELKKVQLADAVHQPHRMGGRAVAKAELLSAVGYLAAQVQVSRVLESWHTAEGDIPRDAEVDRLPLFMPRMPLRPPTTTSALSTTPQTCVRRTAACRSTPTARPNGACAAACWPK